MLALVVTPIETTSSRGAWQELMDLFKLEITFIAGPIYSQRGLSSLSPRQGQLQKMFLSVFAGPQNGPPTPVLTAGTKHQGRPHHINPWLLSRSFKVPLIDFAASLYLCCDLCGFYMANR